MSVDVVTGAFSYSGAAIARRLRDAGRRVRTLTGHPDRAPADTDIEVRPFDFGDPAALARSLTGVDTLYNTFWVRFADPQRGHAMAVANSRTLFDAAAEAGVRRIVHVSITNPSLDSPYSYFRGKAEVEQHLQSCGVPYAVARPATMFGGGGVLLNNIAYLLRRSPVFAVGDGGGYRLRPIHVDDLARLCLQLAERDDSVTVDAVGPDRPTFREMVGQVRAAVGSRSLVVPVPGPLLRASARLLSVGLRDTLLTGGEYRALVDGLADSQESSTGDVRLGAWIAEQGRELGRRYANDTRPRG